MGAGAGKQPKVKKIYVKSRESRGAEEDEVADEGAWGEDAWRKQLGEEAPAAASSSAPAGSHLDEPSSTSWQNPNRAEAPSTADWKTAKWGRETEQGAALDACALSSENSATFVREAAATRPIPPLDMATNVAPLKGTQQVQQGSAMAAIQAAKPKHLQNQILLDGAKPWIGENVDSVQLNGVDYSLTPRSISSDDSSVGAPAPAAFRISKMDFPQQAKVDFTQVLKDGYQRRAQDRSNWLASVGAAAETAVPTKASRQRAEAEKNANAGFNETRRMQPALRDPDIFEQVRKWNVNNGAYKDEFPSARPVRC